MSSEHFDVAVIGAGPAGCTAAAVLAKTGARVCLLGKVHQRRSDDQETLPGAAMRIMRETGYWNSFKKLKFARWHVVESVWGSATPSEWDHSRSPDGPGWHVGRARLDRDVREFAREHGAIHVQEDVKSLTANPGNWELALTGSTPNDRHVSAAGLIDASGRNGMVARRLGITRVTADRLVAHTWQSTGGTPGVIRIEAVAQGWWYGAGQDNAGQQQQVLFADADTATLRTPREWTYTGSRAAYTAFPAQSCGRRWAAVGDASLSMDPLSAQGLFHSLYSGWRGAEALLRELDGDKDALRQYALNVAEIRGHYLSRQEATYLQEQRFADAPFWKRRHAAT